MHRKLTYSLSIICLGFVFSLVSCTKTRTLIGEHHKLQSRSDNVIKTNQAISIFDSDWIKDSVDFVHAPSGRNYRWKSIPDRGCVTFSGQSKNGIPIVRFTCPGTYKIHAEIFDSTTNELVALTDFWDVTVTDELLEPEQPIQKNDTLLITVGTSQITGPLFQPTPLVTTNHVGLDFRTSKTYEYAHISEPVMDSRSSPANFILHFGNYLKLKSYPFAYSKGQYGNAFFSYGGAEATNNQSFPVTITWLGRTYTGKLTFLRPFSATLQLEPNDGMIRIGNF